MARDEQRLAAWNASLGSVSASLRQEWEQAAARTAGRQQEICDALALTAQRISDHTQLQAGETIAEISRSRAAADAPVPPPRCRPSWPRDQDRLQAWTATLESMTAALRQEWQQAGAERPAASAKSAMRVARRANHLRAAAHPGQRHAGRDQPAGRRRRRRAQGRPRVAGRTGRARPRAPRRSASLAEMTAALRQEWQQAGADAANRQREICDALACRAAHLRTDAGPGQRHAGGNQPPGRRRRRRAQAALALQASWPRATASA